MTLRKNILKINGTIFELDAENEDIYSKSELIIKKDDNNKITSIDLECNFKTNYLNGDNSLDVVPKIGIYNIPVPTNKCENLKGLTFEVETPEESYEREDEFYVFEHEPFCDYQLEIIDINDKNAHIILTGNGIIDGYAEPYKKGKIEMDCVIPIRYFENKTNNNIKNNKGNIIDKILNIFKK